MSSEGHAVIALHNGQSTSCINFYQFETTYSGMLITFSLSHSQHCYMWLHCIAIHEAFNSGIFRGSNLLCPVTTSEKVSRYLHKVLFSFMVSVFISLIGEPKKEKREFQLEMMFSSYICVYASPTV